MPWAMNGNGCCSIWRTYAHKRCCPTDAGWAFGEDGCYSLEVSHQDKAPEKMMVGRRSFPFFGEGNFVSGYVKLQVGAFGWLKMNYLDLKDETVWRWRCFFLTYWLKFHPHPTKMVEDSHFDSDGFSKGWFNHRHVPKEMQLDICFFLFRVYCISVLGWRTGNVSLVQLCF